MSSDTGTHTHTQLYLDTYTDTHKYTHTHTHTHIGPWIRACVCVDCVLGCVCVCVRVCVYICQCKHDISRRQVSDWLYIISAVCVLKMSVWMCMFVCVCASEFIDVCGWAYGCVGSVAVFQNSYNRSVEDTKREIFHLTLESKRKLIKIVNITCRLHDYAQMVLCIFDSLK